MTLSSMLPKPLARPPDLFSTVTFTVKDVVSCTTPVPNLSGVRSLRSSKVGSIATSFMSVSMIYHPFSSIGCAVGLEARPTRYSVGSPTYALKGLDVAFRLARHPVRHSLGEGGSFSEGGRGGVPAPQVWVRREFACKLAAIRPKERHSPIVHHHRCPEYTPRICTTTLPSSAHTTI